MPCLFSKFSCFPTLLAQVLNFQFSSFVKDLYIWYGVLWFWFALFFFIPAVKQPRWSSNTCEAINAVAFTLIISGYLPTSPMDGVHSWKHCITLDFLLQLLNCKLKWNFFFQLLSLKKQILSAFSSKHSEKISWTENKITCLSLLQLLSWSNSKQSVSQSTLIPVRHTWPQEQLFIYYSAEAGSDTTFPGPERRVGNSE